ncbi:HupE/UreJ family protein [Methylosinus sp. Sm6]|uniref:HupE/UreJ family protein n=1 Tax=Methylosinus sp. Sm6 TaxID=2866948 RepID=UPI001C98F37D|nr:HupE/UreJ family protein [Methylosinus sp. Sm6]MBY6241690.1 HupE/UreJ family protein [Methylosinus sp. Sm6]
MLRLLVRLLALAPALLAHDARAHLSSDSYLHIDVDARGLRGQWDIALRDLDAAVGLDAPEDGVVTWGRLKARRDAIEAYAYARLAIDGCALQPLDLLVDYHAGAAYAVLRFSAECGATRSRRLHYRLLFDIDPTHRGLLTITTPASERSEILSPDGADSALDDLSSDQSGSVLGFVRFGVGHILLGHDHLLFVAVLMIFAAFRRGEDGRWKPLDGFGESALQTVTILTAFTAAHAVTLSLSAFRLVDAPARLVEPAVAATIMAAAIDNLRPILPRARWIVAFGFGLVHGLAFATALGPMGLSTSGTLLALAGFNGGVELGQIAAASLLLPIVFAARRNLLYVRMIAPALTFVAFVVALAWFVDRVGTLR